MSVLQNSSSVMSEAGVLLGHFRGGVVEVNNGLHGASPLLQDLNLLLGLRGLMLLQVVQLLQLLLLLFQLVTWRQYSCFL